MADLEIPDADAVEQQQPVDDPEASAGYGDSPAEGGPAPLEADEGDVAESSLEVPLDDDDWR